MTDAAVENRRPLLRNAWRYAARYGWVVGLIISAAVLWKLDPGRIWKTLSSLSPLMLAQLLLIQSVADSGRALKWRYVLGKGSRAVGLYFLSKSVAYLTPGRVGEFSPLLIRRHRTPAMGAWLIVDRVLETTATFLIGAGGLIALGSRAQRTLLLSATLAFVLTAALIICMIRKWRFTRSSRRLRKDGLFSKVAALWHETTREMRLLKKKALTAFLLTLTFKLLDVGVWVFSYACLGPENEIRFSLAAAVMCLGGLIATIPITPVLTGVPYLAQGALIVALSDTGSEVAAAAAAIHFAVSNTVFWSLAALGTYDFRKRLK